MCAGGQGRRDEQDEQLSTVTASSNFSGIPDSSLARSGAAVMPAPCPLQILLDITCSKYKNGAMMKNAGRLQPFDSRSNLRSRNLSTRA